MGKNVVRVKLLVCTSFLALVSAMVVFCKYLLLAFIYVTVPISTDKFDRDALLDALVEAEKDSGCRAMTQAQTERTRDDGSLARGA